MSSKRTAAHALLGIAAAAAGAGGVAMAGEDARLRSDLQSLAQRRVFFGHQSVGVNVMDGLRHLAAQQGVILRIAEAKPGAGVPAATFGHAAVAENGDPRRKLQSFEQAFASGAAAGAELAFLKFCYVDFRADTDAAALFAEYQAAVARLRVQHPGTTFVHVTAPLVAVPSDVKSSMKKLLGRPSNKLLVNARRDEYNELLRRAYQGKEPIFDIARIEALRPDGKVEATDWQGRPVPALVDGYTDDGGHLNREGQVRAARELAAVLATVPRPTAPAPGRNN